MNKEKYCIVCNGPLRNEKIDNQRFCNLKCSSKYNNVKRYHPDWTDSEIVQYINKKRYCLVCGTDITAKRKDSLFCHSNCRHKYRRMKKKKGV